MDQNRRRLIRYLAASPLFAAGGHGELRRWLAAIEGTTVAPQQGTVITSPDEAVNVLEFEAAARAALPPAHFGYMASGVDDDATLHANLEAYRHWHLRVRRLVDVRTVDTSVTLFGTTWDTPIIVCPCGSQRAFHADGELATARAARAKGHLQILSGVTTTSVEDVSAARGTPVWFQLYPTNDRAVAMAIVRRAAAAGCPVLVLTVDLNAGRNLETLSRYRRLDTRDCTRCHQPGMAGQLRRKPMYDGLDISRVTDVGDPGMTWDYIARVRDAAPGMKVMLKGIVTPEDASLALRYGADAVMVSNHGGRSEESGRATIDSLEEVATAIGRRIPVLLDGGIRRGTDIVKAIALGATAVGIGRPYLWGLGAFGQPGVEAVLAILRRELELAMRQAGVMSLAGITRAYVDRA